MMMMTTTIIISNIIATDIHTIIRSLPCSKCSPLRVMTGSVLPVRRSSQLTVGFTVTDNGTPTRVAWSGAGLVYVHPVALL